MATMKTPTGLSLDELVKSLKDQNQEIPDSVKELVAEHGSDKARRMAGVPAKAPEKAQEPTSTPKAPETQPEPPKAPETTQKAPEKPQSEVKTDQKPEANAAPQQSKTQSKPQRRKSRSKKKTGRKVLASFLGGIGLKNLADALKKGVPERPKDDPVLRHLRIIRSDITMIKGLLAAQGVKEGTQAVKQPEEKKRPDYLKRGFAAFTRHATGGAIRLRQFERANKKSTVMKVEKPREAVEGDFGYYDKVTPPQAKAMASDLQTKLKIEDQQAKPKKSDQALDADEKSIEEKEKQRKRLMKWLEKIDKDLDDLKKKSESRHSWLTGAMGLAMAGLTWLKTGFKGILTLIKGITKSIAKITKWIGEKVFAGVKKVGSFIKQGWDHIFKRKTVTKEAEKIGEREATKIGGKEAVKIGGKLAVKDVLKAIPVVGAAAGLGFAAYDLAKGNVADAGFDAASGLLGGTGVGDIAGFGVDAAQAAYDLKHADSSPSGPIVKAAPRPAPAALQAATAQAKDIKDDKQNQPTVVVVQGDNKTQVIPITQPSDMSPMSIFTRNPEPSIGRLNSQLFDDPIGWGTLSRL